MIVVVMAVFGLLGVNRRGFLDPHRFALVDRWAMLGKSQAQMAAVAFHQLRGFLGPELFWLQVMGRVLDAEVFDKSFGLGAERPAFGDHGAQVQPIGKGGKPLAACHAPRRLSEGR